VRARSALGERVHWVSATDTAELAAALVGAAGMPDDAAELRRTYDDAAGPDLTVDRLQTRPPDGLRPAPIVVDDAHQLPATSLALLRRVLSATPEQVRLVLLARRDPPLPLVPLDLAGQLVMVRAGQLAFDDGEAAQLVTSHAPRATADDVTQLQEHTKGWAAALILAARSLDAADDPRTAHLLMRSTAQPVLDYLLGESLDVLSAPTRQVLAAICHETEVTAESAVALSDDPSAVEHLTALARDGLLVTAYADGSGGGLVWRLHPLLLEALRRHAGVGGQQSVSDVHRRGAAFARAAGHPEDALRHAVLSGEADLLAELLLDLGPEMEATGGADVVADGLRHLSPAYRAAHPELLGLEALCRVRTGDVAEALALGARAKEALTLAGDAADARLLADVVRLDLWKARLGWGDLPRAVAAASAGLETTPTGPSSIARATATHLELGGAECWLDDLPAALRHTHEALATARSLDYGHLTVAALGQCALLEAARGAMQPARALASECLERAADDVGDGTSRRRAHLARAWAELQSLELDDARADLELSATPAAPLDPLVVVMGAVLQARLLIEDGRLQDAERVLVAPLAVPGPVPGFARALVDTTKAQLAAATGNDDGLDEVIAGLHDIGCTAEARLFGAIRTAYEGHVSEAVADLDDLARTPGPNLVVRSGVEAVRLALLLLVGDAAAARTALPHLLTTVATHRHLHVLTAVLRAGDPFLDALHHEARRADAHPYAAEALAAMRSYEIAYTERRRPLLDASRTTSPRRPDPSSTEAPAPAILSELTPREAEVFEQLALGGSYGDIGRALFVTENTVKTHLASIYRKLGVERRAEALQVGRDRGLLGASAPVPRPRQ
jgi:ATP/maltotriose-dependent transcriptional regulator MalT